ncbi:MAG: ATP-binding cassette domain-containing protein [Desulfosarcinaceae bacterium]|nr:ATP-binding cassette domain-containing protein [Desulfosarcinaceae bacterium]
MKNAQWPETPAEQRRSAEMPAQPDGAFPEDAHITVTNLTMGYGDLILMRDLHFTVNRGDVFAIMGGSGCGKSTLLRILVGLKAPHHGTVAYGHTDFWAQRAVDRKRMMRNLGVMYQNGALWSSMTLAENVGLPLRLHTDCSADEIREIVRFKLALVGLDGFEARFPSQLSGGMRKRAGLARALALDPEILFFDEPSAGLDPVSAKQLDDLILEINRSLDATIVIVTHELASIFAIASNAIFLDAATHTAGGQGAPRKLLDTSENPNLIQFLTRGEPIQRPKGRS